MSEEQTTKKQHYVSRGLLELFSINESQIYECNTIEGRLYKANLNNAMEERNTYEHPFLSNNLIENTFSEIESTFIPKLRSIVNNLRSQEPVAKDAYLNLSELFDVFLLFYYRSGAMLKEYSYGFDSDNKRVAAVNRMLEIITLRNYLKQLAETLKKSYSYAFLHSKEGNFIISDQFISTVALGYKNMFANSSNRAIGMKETMILFPLSSEFYLALFHGNAPNFISENEICSLSDDEVMEINKVIFHNAYTKCAGRNNVILDDLLRRTYPSSDVRQAFIKYSNGVMENYTNKKEIFWYKDDEDIDINRLGYYQEFLRLKKQYGKGKIRNILCPCNSGKKFKHCCLEKYLKAYQSVIETQQRPAPDYRINSNCMAEMPINEFWGIENMT